MNDHHENSDPERLPEGAPGRTALITGASGGIGLELARVFAERGHDLVLVARSGDRLDILTEELRGRHAVRVMTITKDLSIPGAASEVHEEVRSRGPQIDALVNNAGFAIYGRFTETPLGNDLRLLQLNVVAVAELTKLFVSDMVARGRGRVLNIASTAAFAPGPLMSVYYASKAFVLSFSEGLANELEGTGVTVTCLCPGPTHSGFQRAAAMEESKLVKGRNLADAATVARAGYEGMMRARTVVIPGARNAALVYAMRALPRRMTTRIVRRAQEADHTTV